MEIGRVEAHDLEIVRNLASSRLRESYSLDLFQHFYEHYPSCFFVARSQEGVIGFIIGIPMDELKLRVLMLAVKRSKVRNGVGTALMSSAETYASTRMMNSVVLEVGSKNGRAIEFYTKLGYKITGMIPEYYEDKSDAFVMRKFLPA
jgi:ribosomal protein S18 acetylase RimI-like enzyme